MTNIGGSDVPDLGPGKDGMEQVGRVVTYFPKLQVAGVTLKDGVTIRNGDTLVFPVGHHRTRQVSVTSMEINHKPVEEASGPSSVGIWVGVSVARGVRPVYRVCS